MSQKFKSEIELEALNPATTDTDKILVSDGGVVKSRTGAEILSDIGGVGLAQIANFETTSQLNTRDTNNRNRANHTGTQLSSTISDLASSISNNSSVVANTSKVTNATHTGDVTGATALTITNNIVSNGKLSQVPTKTFKGRTTAGAGNVEDLTVSQVRVDLSINNLDNTSDISKPISTATQTALNARITGTGTTNQLAKFTASGAVGPSPLSVDSNNFFINQNGINPVYSLVKDATSTYAGFYILQAGIGSAGMGGSLAMFGHSHATKPGWVVAGISQGSGGRFSVQNAGNNAGTDVFTVDASGNGLFSGLSGTGTRMVVADASGLLSTQTIPSGGGGGSFLPLGGGTLTGALSGTTASFSGTVTANIISISNNGSLRSNGFWGTLFNTGSGSFADFALLTSSNVTVGYVPTNTNNFVFENRLGINTTNPTERLDVVGNGKFSGTGSFGGANTTSTLNVVSNASALGISVLNRVNDDFSNISFYNNAGTTSLSAIGNASGRLRMVVNGIESLSILPTNNFVGIGTTNPTQRLDVVGNGLFSGTVTALGGNSTNWNTAFSWGNHAGLYSTLNHVHTIAQVTGLQSALDNKPSLSGVGASGDWNISVIGSSRLIRHSDGPRNLTNRNPNWQSRSLATDFVTAGTTSSSGNYAGVITFAPWEGTSASTGDSSYQLAFVNETGINGSGLPGLKLRKGIDSTWGAFQTLLHSGNHQNYSLPLSGGTLTGNLAFDGGNKEIQFKNTANIVRNYVWQSGDDLNLGSGSLANSVRINQSGNVSIGNGNNTHKLDVSGNGFFSGNLTATQIYANSWFRNQNANTGLYNEATNNHWYSANNSTWAVASENPSTGQIQLRHNFGGPIKGSFYWDSSGVGLLNDIQGWGLRLNQGANYGGTLFGSWNVSNSLLVREKRVLDLPSNSNSRGPWNPIASSIRGSGNMLYSDEDFALGTNGISIYNNQGGSALVMNRVPAGADGLVAPNSSGFIIKLARTAGASVGTSPGNGGYIHNIGSQPNKTYVQLFQALLPVGRNFILAENPIGSDSTSYWLTNTEGTGKWEWYARIAHCGTVGTFSSAGHVWVDGPDTSFNWYLASSNVYDITDGNNKTFQTINSRAANFSGLLSLNLGNSGSNAYHELNRNNISTENMFTWKTASQHKWYLGQRNQGSENFSLYSVDISNDIFRVTPNGVTTFTTTVVAPTFNGNLNGTATSLSGFNNPTTASTPNTIVYRTADGDVSAREFIHTAGNVHGQTPSSIMGIFPTTNQVVRFNASAIQSFLGLGSMAYQGTGNYYTAGTSDGRFFIDRGFGAGFPSWDANTIPSNSSGFTYSNNAPHTGALAHFGAGGYGLQLNANYSGEALSFRSMNGDNGQWRPWRTLVHSGNIGSQSVNFANSAGNTSSIGNSLGNEHTWTGVNYFQTNFAGFSGNTHSARLQISSTGNNSAFMSFHKHGNFALNMGLDADNVFRIGGWSAAANRLQLDMSGNLTVAGTMSASDFIGTSDKRLKKQIKTLKPKEIQSVYKTFAFKKDNTNQKRIGVIAQELELNHPEFVRTDSEGMKSVSYGDLHSAEIAYLKAKNKELEAKLELIMNKLGI